MTDSAHRDDREPHRGRRMQLRLTTLLGVVAVCGVGLAAYMQYRGSRTPWQRAGGMIGWRQAAIDSRLGPPAATIEGDAPDEHARRIRPRPAGGRYRTCVYRTLDGDFVVRLRDGGRGYECFGSSWRGRYY